MPQMRNSEPPLEVIYKKVEADSKFSLYYLNTVITAIDVSTELRNNAATVGRALKQVLTRLAESGGNEKPFDPTGNLASISATAEAAVKETIVALQNLNGTLGQSIVRTDDNDTMVAINEEAICALQRTHDLLVDLRWAVIEHDADLEKPKGKAFQSVADIIEDLQSS